MVITVSLQTIVVGAVLQTTGAGLLLSFVLPFLQEKKAAENANKMKKILNFIS